jgi:hypothetical protein
LLLCNTLGTFLAKGSALAFQNYLGGLSEIREERIPPLQPGKMTIVSDDAQGRVRDAACDFERFKRRRKWGAYVSYSLPLTR